MDGLIFFGFLILLFIFVAPIIAFVRAGRAARAAKEAAIRSQEVEKHLHSLDKAIAELRTNLSGLAALESEVRALKEKLAAEAPPPVSPPPSLRVEQPIRDSKVEIPVPVPPPVLEEIPPAVAEVTSSAPFESRPTDPVTPPNVPEIAAPVMAGAVSPRAKSGLNIEEILGTNWLNKLGIIILVIGVAFFLAYQLQHVGPAGKVFAGYAVSIAILGAGIFFERRERWRVLARAAIGGGWALFFFTTYAMNHVSAARVLESETADFVLLVIVAAAMVAHTLRYQSQVVTGLAFLLAFSTINISHGGASGLWAAVILSAGLAVIAVRRNWYELEVFGLLAAYLNHYYWLRPIIEPMGAHHHAFPELNASTTLLIAYWLIFRASYILRRIEQKYQENVSTVAALLNTFLFHSVIAYQAARPELAFPFLLGVGSTELVLGQLPITRRRRSAFVILSTVGVVLIGAAFSYRFSGGKLSVIWLLEAEALLLAGVFTREILFRRLGILAAALAAGHMLFIDAHNLLHARDVRGIDFSDPRMALIFAVAALVLFANSHWLMRRSEEFAAKPWDVWSFRILSYFAAPMAMLAVWAVSTEKWWAVGWAALALVAAAAGARWKIKELAIQGHALALLGIVRALAVNLSDPWGSLQYDWHPWRLTTVLLVVISIYLSARWMVVREWTQTARVSQVYSWAGSTLVALLIWYQLLPISVALGWMLLGLAALELGFSKQSLSLRLQGYVAIASTFLRMFFVNLNAAGLPGQISPRLYTTLPLAAGFFYVYWRLKGSPELLDQWEKKLAVPSVASYFGTIALVALVRFEMDADFVVAIWAAMVFVLLTTASRYDNRMFLHQGLLLSFALLFRCLFHNFYERSYFPPTFWHGRMFSVGATVVLLFIALPFAFRLKIKSPDGAEKSGRWPFRVLRSLGYRPDQVCFFIPFILLTVLLAVEMRSGLVTLAWGVEAVAVFLFALWIRQRSYRVSGLALLLVCVGKIVLLDVWALQPRDRYMTFIVLGAALLGVSILYTRYRDSLRQYL
jgi:uncharacterized membrane protein